MGSVSSYVVRARYEAESPDETEASRRVSTPELDDERLAHLAADAFAEAHTTDVVLIVRDQTARVLVWKGVEWFAVEKLDREFPGWQLGARPPRLLSDEPTYIHGTTILPCTTDEGGDDGVQIVYRRPVGLPEDQSEPDEPRGDPPYAPPKAA